MIIEGIINLVYPIIDFIVSLLPNADSTIVNFIGSGVSYFRTVLNFGNAYFDMTSLVLVLGFVFTIEFVLMLFKFGRWIITMLTVGFVKAN